NAGSAAFYGVFGATFRGGCLRPAAGLSAAAVRSGTGIGWRQARSGTGPQPRRARRRGLFPARFTGRRGTFRRRPAVAARGRSGAGDPSTTFFQQIVDDDGRQWFDHDSVPVDASQWRPGDGLLTLMRGAVRPDAPRQAYWWSLGMYVEGGRRVPLPDGASQVR